MVQYKGNVQWDVTELYMVGTERVIPLVDVGSMVTAAGGSTSIMYGGWISFSYIGEKTLSLWMCL
jgi:hypothetical protein